MKRWICLAALLCLLGGCAEPPASELPAPVAESTPEPAPLPAAEPIPVDTTPTEVEMEVLPDPVWRGSGPQQGEPITPQPGDTAVTWDPIRAGDYPADADCTPMELLEKWMTVEGLTMEDLQARDCRQLVLSVAQEDGVTNLTTCYSRQPDGTWAAEAELTAMPGFMGKNGIAHNRRRSSLQSPAGLWGLGSAFGLAEAPEGQIGRAHV